MSKLYIGLDVSNALTSICAIDQAGEIAFELKVASDPDAIAAALRPHKRKIVVVGHEAGSLSQWLHVGMIRHRLPVRCLDSSHAHAALKAQRHKTDRNDALGIARIVKSGWVRDAHIRSPRSAQLRMALIMRRTLQRKIIDLELCLRQSVKVFGVKVGASNRKDFADKLRGAIGDDKLLQAIVHGVLRGRAALYEEFILVERELVKVAESDDVCRRLMTVPGVGPITALWFKATVDDPTRFGRSRLLGVYFGLTPRRRQSGEHDGRGSISKRGDPSVRSLLCFCAGSVLRAKAPSRLKLWAVALRKRASYGQTCVAVARKVCAILHRIWISGGVFDPGLPAQP
ncbi:MAG: transposase IS110 family protein [Alphaproteobacteria bacterium]|nr:MAG: transposase family protein [Caulobacteraceae bacterium]TPW04126.1 MAG: transposase IS110 family protein [Alphaproteobacteria bacterium]